MEISALTRSVVKRTHAVIAPDGYINSTVPGWTNCSVNVLINEQMGANFCQTLITAKKNAELKGKTRDAQIFFYVIDGSSIATISGEAKKLTKGHFVYIPPGKEYLFSEIREGTKLLTFHKVYEQLEGYDIPQTIFGDAANIPGPSYLEDDALKLQVLLPDNLSFDMAVNIFAYEPGGHLPIVETHIMEHGLMYLQGQGVYMLDHEWYPVKRGDSIWMAPYCQQWFTAMGKEAAVYIYYKNVNRFPTTV
jgi:(S)-ureidoglycine aminohydrolase